MIKIAEVNRGRNGKAGDGNAVVLEKFPNGETRINLKDIVSKHASVHEIIWKYESDSDFLTLAFIADYIRDNCEKQSPTIVLSILYMPYSRMDRSENGSVFTLKTACSVLNSIGFDVVNVYEPHSSITTDLLLNSHTVMVSDVLATMAIEELEEEYPDTPVVVFYPDKGAQARYDMMEGVQFLCGKKVRDFDTGRIVEYSIIDAEIIKQMNGGKPFNVVIIDDLSSYGGTFVQASKKLKEIGADKICLAVTHAEESVYKGELFKHIDRLYTTNSILEEAKNDETTLIKLV